MKKRAVSLLLLIVMALSVSASAAETRAVNVRPSLTFQGTTAYCEASIISASDSISATLELWNGSSLVQSWSGSGTGTLYLGGSHPVKSGITYTLKISGTIAGVAFTGVTVTGKC